MLIIAKGAYRRAKKAKKHLKDAARLCEKNQSSGL